jgi:hypothetical protein
MTEPIATLKPQIIQEWLKRPANKRTEDDIFYFYNHLSQERPDLLNFRCSSEKYQYMKTVLRSFITPK